ncbi:hypothetical protein PN441_05415 [Spirulina major CS-329]|uniref:GIY-YIG nuclease family protein n=1 Tax=Spirulina TaxID=1154 RepID=UPI00232B7E82|nr:MULTISPECIES: hypothetical protein [Spirulina]MDB9493335.1 hypothetical protein [Spirulina subsalsa CS-330]MDB9502504.1 hypothetical protein [Spirulina major CS-329]
MIADTRLLGLVCTSLKMKDILPEYAGIYYVVDASNTVWYIGQAQNIRKRWQGKSHHRIHQFIHQKNQDFRIFCEPVPVKQLSDVETARISAYRPHLNNTPTKPKKVHPTETLLRETIAAIADFSFILGIEPPRGSNTENGLIAIMAHPKVLPLEVIHIYVDSQQIQSLFKLETIGDEVFAIRKHIFSTRKAYANKWEAYTPQYPFLHRLYVGGYAVEIAEWTIKSLLQNKPWTPEYHEVTLAGEVIRALTPRSLADLQKQLSSSYGYHIKRLRCYSSDCIPLLFNENIDLDARKESVSKVAQDYSQGQRGLGSRGSLRNQKKILIFVRCFGFATLQDSKIGISAQGVIDGQWVDHQLARNFETLYFLTEVNQETWRQVSSYLYDFVIPAQLLRNGEGYVTHVYVSPRKELKLARLTVKCKRTTTSVSIPLGASPEFPTFELVKAEIRRRVASQNLNNIQLSFRAETTTQAQQRAGRAGKAQFEIAP